MFIGQYIQKVDDKNRIIVPAKFRNMLTEGAIITIGYDKCLSIYTADEWEKLLTKLTEMSETKSDYRKHVRAISSNATECDLDSHGRVLIPQTLLQTAGINKDIVIVGALNRAEIWSKESWDAYNSDSIENFDTLSETLE